MQATNPPRHPGGGRPGIPKYRKCSKTGGLYEFSLRAKKRMDEVHARSGAPPVPGKNVGEWLQQWLDTYALDRCQPKTLERYRQLAAYLLKTSSGEPSALAQTPLADLTHQQLEATFYGLLKAKGKRRKHISARTVRHVAGLLNVALNKAFKLEFIQVNPMLRVE